MMAVARQRKESGGVERVARGRADQVTSHWWQGLVLFSEDVERGGDGAALEGTPPRKAAQKAGEAETYQTHVEKRIRLSRAKGIALALPDLRDRLGLSLFEKNLMLLCLAPEVSRRYERLYSYLQNDFCARPLVDLALRLFCRSEEEWRQGRALLSGRSPLLRFGLLQRGESERSLLTCPLSLSGPTVDFLLGQAATMPPPTLTWAALVVPQATEQLLREICARVRGALKLGDAWPTRVLFIGPEGSGKTLAAQVIAAELQLALAICQSQAELGQPAASPIVRLLKGAEVRPVSRPLEEAGLWPGLVIFSSRSLSPPPYRWRQQMDYTVRFSLPDRAQRRRIWAEALPPDFDLDFLAQIELSGGKIRALAQAAEGLAAGEGEVLSLVQVLRVLRRELEKPGYPNQTRKLVKTRYSQEQSQP